ncbi:sensor histidine kinase [Rhodohalobacter sp. 8-1]|uniref:sensor histidine kinase n=1 Tax=Rhodohalobacter sp. 8-1 TaxID=3131972 RepID=UPI0030ECC0F5
MDKHKNDSSIKSDQEKQLRNIARLVDDHYELEEKYIQVLSELDLLKSRMKNLNHDIRSPLGGITGMMDLLIIEEDDIVKVRTSDLNIIKESAQSLLNLVNGTLLVGESQKEGGSKNIDRKLSSAMLEINRLYLPMAQNKDLSLSLRTYIDTEIRLTPDFYINLIQIAGNLVSNAVKFTPSGGSVNVVFTLDEGDDQTTLNITVVDSGKGMLPDQVSAFNQGKPVERANGTNGEQSFGIGLQHVKKMVSDEDGHIDVKSDKNSGTIFSLSFPLPDNNLNRINTSSFTLKDGALLLNGSQK